MFVCDVMREVRQRLKVGNSTSVCLWQQWTRRSCSPCRSSSHPWRSDGASKSSETGARAMRSCYSFKHKRACASVIHRMPSVATERSLPADMLQALSASPPTRCKLRPLYVAVGYIYISLSLCMCLSCNRAHANGITLSEERCFCLLRPPLLRSPSKKLAFL